MMKPIRDPNRPKVPEMLVHANAIYARHLAGCCWHVVLDDGNYDSAAFCIEYARKEGHADCRALADLVEQGVTRTQLAKLSQRIARGQ